MLQPDLCGQAVSRAIGPNDQHDRMLDGAVWVERRGLVYFAVVILKGGPEGVLTGRGFELERYPRYELEGLSGNRYIKRFEDYWDCCEECYQLSRLGIRTIPYMIDWGI